jgi:glycosyltransferase A (GT-A) superfamily protein (DUF2064 family)
MRVAIGVFAEPPLPGRCCTKLLAAHAPEWAAGLYAAMLRDTLDGLLSIDASEYLVFAEPDEEGASALRRRVPAPWTVVTDGGDVARALRRLGGDDDLAIVARSDAPAAPIDPVLEMITSRRDAPYVALAPADDGSAWLLGASRLGLARSELLDGLPWGTVELAATIRVRCTKAGVALHELPVATVVAEPSGVLAMLDELRRNPERAPRTAQFIVTQA